MTVDVSRKQLNWLTRAVQDAVAMVDAIDRAKRTFAEYSDLAYNGGDPTNRPEYEITSEFLAASSSFAHLDKSKLNALAGAIDAISNARAASAGVLGAARP